MDKQMQEYREAVDTLLDALQKQFRANEEKAIAMCLSSKPFYNAKTVGK